MSSTEKILEVDHVTMRFGGVTALVDVDFHIDKGEILGLIGPNGAGKTTCFYMIVGLIPMDGGIIRLDEASIGDLPMHKRARLGVNRRAGKIFGGRVSNVQF